MKTVMVMMMMMMANITTAISEPDVEAALSRAILLLDFRQAYDTVDRDFLFLVLRRFSFSSEFVEMIRLLHEGTTAPFFSEWASIRSSGGAMPSSPALFLQVTEILALAITQAK